MKVIALKGEPKCGKTTTLSLLRKIMVQAGFAEDSGTFKDLYNKDFRVVLLFHQNGKVKKIGIVTQGDYAINVGGKVSVKSHLDYMKERGCEVVVCACTNGKKKICDAINIYDPKYITKQRHDNDLRKDTYDNDCASQILEIVREMLSSD